MRKTCGIYYLNTTIGLSSVVCNFNSRFNDAFEPFRNKKGASSMLCSYEHVCLRHHGYLLHNIQVLLRLEDDNNYSPRL